MSCSLSTACQTFAIFLAQLYPYAEVLQTEIASYSNFTSFPSHVNSASAASIQLSTDKALVFKAERSPTNSCNSRLATG